MGKFLYSKLERVYEDNGLNFVNDSAFCTSNTPFLIKSSQDDLTADAEMLTLNEQLQDNARKCSATSMQQSDACVSIIISKVEGYVAI